MMYSVWNASAGEFDYYETSAQQPQLNVEKPGHLVSRTLGSTVDQAAWPLPSSAKKVGSGSTAIGRVATTKSGAALGALESGDPMIKAALMVGAAFLIWKATRSHSRRRHS